MQYLFALLVVVALVACTLAQYYPYGNYYGGSYYNTHAAYPGYYGNAYNYGAYNPAALGYLWKK